MKTILKFDSGYRALCLWHLHQIANLPTVRTIRLATLTFSITATTPLHQIQNVPPQILHICCGNIVQWTSQFRFESLSQIGPFCFNFPSDFARTRVEHVAAHGAIVSVAFNLFLLAGNSIEGGGLGMWVFIHWWYLDGGALSHYVTNSAAFDLIKFVCYNYVKCALRGICANI